MHLLIYYDNVDQLCERLITVWCKLHQAVANHAIDERSHRLSACVHAEGGRFERYL